MKYIESDGTIAYRGDYAMRGRRDCPAMLLSIGTSLWFQNDKVHRWNGAAALLINGESSWWVDGLPFEPKASVQIAKVS
jgi:hypothetical protein